MRGTLALALFMVSDQYTGHKATRPHLVYTGDRMNLSESRNIDHRGTDFFSWLFTKINLSPGLSLTRQ